MLFFGKSHNMIQDFIGSLPSISDLGNNNIEPNINVNFYSVTDAVFFPESIH